MRFSISQYCNRSELRSRGLSRMIEAVSFGLKLNYEECLHLSNAPESVTRITPLYDSRIHEIKMISKIQLVVYHQCCVLIG